MTARPCQGLLALPRPAGYNVAEEGDAKKGIEP